MAEGGMVEVSLLFDLTGATEIPGAHITIELICLWASGRV